MFFFNDITCFVMIHMFSFFLLQMFLNVFWRNLFYLFHLFHMSEHTHVPRRPCFFWHFTWQPTAHCPYFEGLKRPILAILNGRDNLVVSWWEFRLLGKQSDQTGKSLFPAHCSNGGKKGNLALLGINCRLKRTPNILAAKEAPFALLARVCRRRRHSCGRRSESRSNFMRNPPTTPEGQRSPFSGQFVRQVDAPPLHLHQ